MKKKEEKVPRRKSEYVLGDIEWARAGDVGGGGGDVLERVVAICTLFHFSPDRN